MKSIITKSILSEKGKNDSKPDSTALEWEKEFNRKFVKEIPPLEFVVASPDEIKSFISSLLAEQKKELVEEIRKWTKGKDVTKDKLRQYLNLLRG